MLDPRVREGPDVRPGAGRLHRHVPAPPPPLRRPRARRLLAADRRLPRALRRPVHRRLRPADRRALEPGLRPGRPRRRHRRQPERRHRPHAASCSSSPASATRSVVCCSASRCSAPACWRAGPPLLLAYGTTSALALAVLPESFNRPFAVPTGVALIGLGVSLWRDQRRQAETVDARHGVGRGAVGDTATPVPPPRLATLRAGALHERRRTTTRSASRATSTTTGRPGSAGST